TMAPVALAIVGAVRVWEDGRLRWWMLAGAGAGLAVGFKYTAGLVLLSLAVAAVGRLVRDRRAGLRTVLVGSLAAAAACLLAFFVTNPYFFFELSDVQRQLSAQATTAGEFGKVGQNSTGAGYYLGTMTWGIGWVAALAALAGAVLELRRDVVRGLAFIAFPVALFVYLSLQARFFSRWLLPAYPVLALLAGSALAQAASWLAGLRPRLPAYAASGLLALLVAVAVAQPLAADARSGAVLGHTDTRQIARQWLVDNHPSALRVVIEPAVPARYYRRQGRGGLSGRKAFVRGFAKHQAETRVQYPSLLKPDYIDAYRRAGFCLVMTMSVIEGRAVNAKLPSALAYYDRLRRESDVVFHVSPYKPGAKPPRFDFDFSYNYYPSAFHRPGPEVTIYKLHNCKQGFGPLKKGEPLPGGIS
ncbi:MAG: glycosyltransferase family 39 protein, partial [Thermoleophilaceae bacterium]